MGRPVTALTLITLLAVGSVGCSSAGDSAVPDSGANGATTTTGGTGTSTGAAGVSTTDSAADGSAVNGPTEDGSTTRTSPRQTEITVVAPPTTSPSTTSRKKSSPKTSSHSAKSHTPQSSKNDAPTTRSKSTADTATAPRTTVAPKTTTSAAATTSSQSPTTHSTHSAPPTGGSDLSHAVVVIDPGHNGANAAHPEIIHQQVPAGFGEYKNCNTTGTETNAGYPEYRFNWGVALAVRDALQSKGITVVMTRDSDDGVGPCVNKRAAIGNAEYHGRHADAVVSIHGDGEAESIHGFYVMTASRPPAGAAVAKQSDALAAEIRDGMTGAGFPVSNALGSNGLWQRSDLGGLNLSMRPTVMIECGNMRNAHEADVMSSKDGQQQYADGIAAGVIAFLGR